MIGKTISHYRILNKLGEGGMGVVYIAEDIKLDRHVVLKFLSPHLSSDENERQRFIQEAKAASALDHPNICTIYEIDETDDGQIFIAMAYYQGETLKNKIENGPLKINEATDIVSQIASGLSKAHEQGIVHRDIKPANIMITDDGVVKILDFGLAKLRGQIKLTKTGTTIGTVAYMSPEQTRSLDVDQRTDIWSLGVILYEMLTGQLPFSGDYEQSVMYSIVNEPQRPIIDLKSDLPDFLVQIVNKSLEKELEDRYHSAHEIHSLLAEHIVGSKAFPEVKLRQPNKTKRILLPLSAVVILALVFIFLPPIFQDEPLALSPEPVMVLPFENQTGNPNYDYLKTAIPNLLITNIEQSKYIRPLTWERMHDLLKVMGKADINVVDINKETGFEMCESEGVRGIVLGSFTKADDIFATDIKILNVQNKELLLSKNSQGNGVSSILKHQIDELSKAISDGVLIPTEDIKEENLTIGNVTTSSIEAYKYYRIGIQRYLDFDYLGTVTNLEKAIELDSSFAMAYHNISKAYKAFGYEEKSRKASINALVYVEKSTPKEALYIRMRYAAVIEANMKKALELNEQLVRLFPKEKEAKRRLGYRYRQAGRYLEAIDAYNKAIELDPNWGYVYNDLAYLYAMIGNFDDALSRMERYVALSSQGPNPLDSMGEILLVAGRLDEAIATFELAIETYPDWYGGFYMTLSYVYALKENYDKALLQYEKLYALFKRQFSIKNEAELLPFTYRYNGFIYHLVGRYDEALNIYRKIVPLAVSIGNIFEHATAQELMALICAEAGDFDQARQKLKEALRIRLKFPPEQHLRWQLSEACFSGFIDVKSGEIDSARAKLNIIQKFIPNLNIKHVDIYTYWADLLNGEIVLAAGKPEEAITIFNKITLPNPYYTTWWYRPIYSTPVPRDGLARALYESNDITGAIAEYKRLSHFNPDSDSRFLINPKYHFRLAKLFQETNQAENAVQEYETFLNIWKNADENLPELIEARKNLAKLKQN